MIFFYLLCCCLSLWYCCVSWVFSPSHTYICIPRRNFLLISRRNWVSNVTFVTSFSVLLSLCLALIDICHLSLSVCVCKCIYICVFEALFAQIFPEMRLSYNFRWKSAAQQMIVMTTISHKLTPKLAKRTQAESRTRSILCDSIDRQWDEWGRQKAKQIDRQLETQM